MFFVVLLFFREPRKAGDAPPPSLATVARNFCIVLGNYRLVYAGFLIAWFLPNTQQWTRLRQDTASSEPAREPAVPAWGQWNPARWWNWVVPGIVLALCILELLNGKPSEFLYFQF